MSNLNAFLSSHYIWTIGGYVVLFLFVYRFLQKKFKNQNLPYQFLKFNKMKDTIKSCGSFIELTTCLKWIEKSEYSLNPKAVQILKDEWNKKEKELEQEAVKLHGVTVSKIQ